MDYEKKYKDLVEAVKMLKEENPSDEGIQNWVKDNVPELKESDDERIRKAIYIYLDWLEGRKDYAPKGKYSIRDMLAWLEKQGEQKPTKVEPKFHEGDWITNGATNPAQISSIKDGMYFTHNDTLGGDIEFIDKEYHLWAIQDAKDGDVLASDNSIFIFQEEYIAEKPVAYCGLINGLFVKGEDACWTNEKCHPATKEQRELLFQKMKEAGYEWDTQKKELKKIELNEWVPKKGDVCKPKKGGNNILLCDQDGIAFSFVEYVKNGCAGGEIYIPTLLKEYELVEPKDYNTFDISFNAKDSELQEASYYIPKGYHAEIDGDKVVIKKGEQKPIETRTIGYWNVQEMITPEESLGISSEEWNKIVDDSIYGEQKPTWSEEDECYMVECINAIATKDGWSFEEKRKTKHWLKSLKDRVKGE